jgi:hypothetical protein
MWGNRQLENVSNESLSFRDTDGIVGMNQEISVADPRIRAKAATGFEI